MPIASARFSPLSQRKAQQRRETVIALHTSAGVVRIIAWYGWDPGRRTWGCPVRECWGLEPRQQMSPRLEDVLAYTVTATGSYREAAALAQKWECQTDPWTLQVLTQRLGQRAEEQTQARLKTLPVEIAPQRAASEVAIFMLDGWQGRFRGLGWGKKRTKKKRVEWHELKVGVFYLKEQAGQTAGGRGMLSEKVVVSWQGDGAEVARRLQWEAQRRGLGRAQSILVIADGAAWIWNVADDRWADATELLDFYHASEHVWMLGRALYGEEAGPWVEERLHQLRHGQEKKFLAELANLKAPKGDAGKTVVEQQNYFQNQSERLAYKEIFKRGWPIGSGAVESACSGQQGRFKQRGQFWTQQGFRDLSSLKQARETNHWDELWFAA
jgi:hypothetical protein